MDRGAEAQGRLRRHAPRALLLVLLSRLSTTCLHDSCLPRRLLCLVSRCVQAEPQVVTKHRVHQLPAAAVAKEGGGAASKCQVSVSHKCLQAYNAL